MEPEIPPLFFFPSVLFLSPQPIEGSDGQSSHTLVSDMGPRGLTVALMMTVASLRRAGMAGRDAYCTYKSALDDTDECGGVGAIVWGAERTASADVARSLTQLAPTLKLAMKDRNYDGALLKMQRDRVGAQKGDEGASGLRHWQWGTRDRDEWPTPSALWIARALAADCFHQSAVGLTEVYAVASWDHTHRQPVRAVLKLTAALAICASRVTSLRARAREYKHLGAGAACDEDGAAEVAARRRLLGIRQGHVDGGNDYGLVAAETVAAERASHNTTHDVYDMSGAVAEERQTGNQLDTQRALTWLAQGQAPGISTREMVRKAFREIYQLVRQNGKSSSSTLRPALALAPTTALDVVESNSDFLYCEVNAARAYLHHVMPTHRPVEIAGSWVSFDWTAV